MHTFLCVWIKRKTNMKNRKKKKIGKGQHVILVVFILLITIF